MTIPPIITSFRGRNRVRFRANGTVNDLEITRNDLLGMLLVGVTTTSVARVLSAIRLKEVEIYSVGAYAAALSSGTELGATATIWWTSLHGPGTHKTYIALAGEPQRIKSSPPPDSFARLWSYTDVQGVTSTDTEVILKLTVSEGAYVDFTFDYVMQNGETPVVFTGLTGVTVGKLYVPYQQTSTELAPLDYDAVTAL